RRVLLELRFGADFADILECKQKPDKRGRSSIEVEDRAATLVYERDRFRRETLIAFSAPCRLERGCAVFELELEPHASWKTCIDVTPVVEDRQRTPRKSCDEFGRAEPKMPETLNEWLDEAPALDAEADHLLHTYRTSLLDLAALRFKPRHEESLFPPAAGLPWFMALFGRDSLITGYEALPFKPALAEAALRALAPLQAREFDDFHDAEPGKIPHELRYGELTVLGERPHDPYYGSHDATPLFLIVLDEYERWTGDIALVRKLEPTARRALAWLEGAGDLDGDGYLEYRSRSESGLQNHCWKDSDDAIRFADGRCAAGPIATCELQGYAYDARRRAARLAREVWGDKTLAERLQRDAAALRERFDRDFWIEERGHYAFALDGEKRQVDALTSNIGHLLWSGIVPEGRARKVIDRLLGEDMFTGWGLRTLSASGAAYNPLGYHLGTIWPHDTAIAAEGIRRYGRHEEAIRIARGLAEAAEAFAHRLPECFAGFPRDGAHTPIEYTRASRPQAFAAAAPLLLLRTLLGLDVVDGEVRSEPYPSSTLGHVGLRGIAARGKRFETGT
ncbi:MAG: amylo-alpha-1,6-glucosidase, partial [Actinobacteria bacterium]|nr:amylo-alpha-1,6-glucosidase [Actinomycetota bacterium]